MKKEYIVILIIFFLFAGPGPSLFFLNQYTVTLLPLFCITSFLYILRREILIEDFNIILKSYYNYKIIFNGLKYCIFAHALSSLIFGSPAMLMDDLLSKYLIMSVNVVFIGPIVEEIVYRKIIYGTINQKYHFVIASTISSLIFAMAHLSLERSLAYFLVGMILCTVYKKTNTLYSSIVVHCLLNLIPILFKTLKG